MPVESYDALTAPPAAEWLAMGEDERIALVLEYHHRIGDSGERERLHCLLHVIAENQLAMGEDMEPVRDRLRQLMAQGLDRHHALHAICYVLARHMQWVSMSPQSSGDQNRRYFRELGRMNAQKYRAIIR